MAFLVIVVNVGSGIGIGELNAKVGPDATNPHECMDKAVAYLQGMASKTPGATVQVTTRDTDPSVSTSGSGSAQVSLALS